MEVLKYDMVVIAEPIVKLFLYRETCHFNNTTLLLDVVIR